MKTAHLFAPGGLWAAQCFFVVSAEHVLGTNKFRRNFVLVFSETLGRRKVDLGITLFGVNRVQLSNAKLIVAAQPFLSCTNNSQGPFQPSQGALAFCSARMAFCSAQMGFVRLEWGFVRLEWGCSA